MTDVINFRKDILDALKSKAKRYDVTDTKVSGLRLTIFPTGVKTYNLYRKVMGKPQRIKIGRYAEVTIEQARNQAKLYNSKIILGGNPHEEKLSDRKEIDFNELYDLYYHQYAIVHTKCAPENKKVLDYHFIPLHGKDKLSDITSEVLKSLHIKIGESRGKVVANRVMNLVSSTFNYGIENKKFRGINPCLTVKRYKKVSRDRFLGKEELTKFLEALEDEDILFQDYFSLLLFTGVRKTNLLSMRWEEVDFDLKRWRIPEDKTKNDDVNIVHLARPAIEILKRRKDESKSNVLLSPYVFPGTGKKGHLADPKKSFQRIKKRMSVSNIRIHDLRRTLGSYMAINGSSLPIIGQALNHKSHVSTAVYARLSQDPVSEAINKAVDKMLGESIDIEFKENITLCVATFRRERIKFSELLTAA